MNNYLKMNKKELEQEYQINMKQYTKLKSKKLSLNMSRGKPSVNQLNLSMSMLDSICSNRDLRTLDGSDVRNYGQLDGIPEMKELFAELLDVKPENIMVGGNSSLNMMFDCINWTMSLGIMGNTPWAKLDKIKFLCPVPGYDRHFAICELFGIEMINIPMHKDGPDMDMIQNLAENDESIKGIWCVPMYSNPTGITYSDETVQRFAALKPAAKDFRIYWDNAYCVHHLTNTPDKLLNIFKECKKYGNEDLVFEFSSTSKISFSGAGIAVMAASIHNMEDLKKKRSIQTIGPNKINQLMHTRYFKNANDIQKHMEKHKALIAPKFKTVLTELDKNIAPHSIANYTRPNGGYFISFNAMNGCAKRIGELCKNAGVILTKIGSTFPYGKDENDSNIRIAPTYPPIEELKQAIDVFCICVKLATIEKLINKI